jgi:trk system potassium uptake protein TrkH
MRAILANLGFVLQFAGLFILIPIAIAFYFNEITALISLFITTITFFGIGFLLNALCERKELDFKSSCALITIVFVSLALIGSIPYFYTRTFSDQNIFSEFSNSFFESASGYTTTGLTLVKDPDALPESIVFYRSLTQWIGGLGIVYIFLAFFYPGNAITQFSKAIGIESLGDIKKTFISVLLIYCLFTGIFILIFYAIGVENIINATSLVFSTISTGGFSPTKDLSAMFVFPNNLIWNFLMIVGATSFIVHYNFFTAKLRRIFTPELITLILIIISVTILVSLVANFDPITSFFHVVSSSTTTGYSFLNLSKLGESVKIILIIIMLIGGCKFATAGGFKIGRLLLILKSIPWSIKQAISGIEEKFTFNGQELRTSEIFQNVLIFLLGIFIILVVALIFSLSGFSFTDSLFEVSSAFATTGHSVGITSIELLPALKWLLAIVMILGRIEVLPFLIAITPKK